MKGHARNLMTERVTAVAPGTELDAIAQTLVAERISGVPVVDQENHVLGIVSETDLLAALLRDRDGHSTAKDVMSQPPITVDEFATTDEVLELMRESHIHHLPVVREGRLVGIISPLDVLRFFVERVLEPPPEVG
jgi:CBS domain-containing protein